jgi:hypothetical protein
MELRGSFGLTYLPLTSGEVLQLLLIRPTPAAPPSQTKPLGILDRPGTSRRERQTHFNTTIWAS